MMSTSLNKKRGRESTQESSSSKKTGLRKNKATKKTKDSEAVEVEIVEIAKKSDDDSSSDTITILSVTKKQESNDHDEVVVFLGEERLNQNSIPRASRSRSREDEVEFIEERMMQPSSSRAARNTSILPIEQAGPSRGNLRSEYHEMDEAMARNLQEQEYQQIQVSSLSNNVAALRAAGMDEATIRSILAEDLPALAQHRGNFVQEETFDDSYEALLALGEQIGNVKPKGLPKHLISRLSVKRFLVDKDKTTSKEELQCIICMSDYESNDKLTGLPCCHYFHTKCLEKWLVESPVCPVCRCDIKEHVE